MDRVFWYSDDFFTIIHWEGNTIILLSTTLLILLEDSNWKQMIYVSPSHIGDTLSVWGCIDDLCDGVYFIVID